MGKEVREISRFFVAPPHVFAPRPLRGFTHFLTQKYLHLSTTYSEAPLVSELLMDS